MRGADWREAVDTHAGAGAEGVSRVECAVSRWARLVPDREALVFGELRWTWRQLEAEVASMAAWLRSREVNAGDRITLCAANHPEFVFLIHAVARVGATLVPLNARLTDAELSPLRERARAKLHLRVPIRCEENPSRMARGRQEVGSALNVDAPQAILFTSGTTGAPKGAVLTVGNLRAAAMGSAERLETRETDRWLGTLPLFHVGGLSMVIRCAVSGCVLVLHERFETVPAAESFEREGITHASFVPTTLARVLEARGERDFPSRVRAVLIGGGPVSRELLERARKRRLPVLQTYGLTESCAQATTEPPDSADATTAGPPLPHLELRIVDEQGRPLPAGGEGEIELRGTSVTSGYFDNPEATSAAFRGGWFRTRDLGVLDPRGRLSVLSRRTDLIVRGGENVYPAEVEQVLEQHPSIIEAAVIPEVHADWGQVPVAIVALRDAVSDDSLTDWCRERLARFKLPQRFLRTQSLPRNAMGKVDRNELQAQLNATSADSSR